MKILAKNAFSSWVRAYTAHRGELKRIFVVKKLHLGHVAKSFGLKDQPSLVNKSLARQSKKRKRDQKQKGTSKKRVFVKKPWTLIVRVIKPIEGVPCTSTELLKISFNQKALSWKEANPSLAGMERKPKETLMVSPGTQQRGFRGTLLFIWYAMLKLRNSYVLAW